MNHNRLTMTTILWLMIWTCLAQDTTDLKVPQTFGLITVTHARGGDNSQFELFMSRYAPMDCPIITEMNIVWNNEQSPEQMGVFKTSSSWKRPINFYRTPNNSMNWRYKIPEESKAQVYFSIDDDISVGCEELIKGFRVWQSNAFGQIGPIVSYGPRYHRYTVNNGLSYGRYKVKSVYSIGLVGLAFISRHFLELYYADLWQLQEMRKVVVQKNNCDDIGLNWLIQYFYPEMQTIAISGDLQNISPAIAQATSATHYPYRTQCIRLFTNIFGINALRYKPMVEHFPGIQKRNHPLKKELVLAKKEYFEVEVLHKRKNELETNNDEAVKPPQTEPSSVNANQYSGSANTVPSNVNLEVQLADVRLAEINLMISKDNLKDQVQRCQQSLIEIKDYQQKQLIKAEKPIPTKAKQTKSQVKGSLLTYIGLFIVAAVILLILRKVIRTSHRKHQPSYENNHIAIPMSQEASDIIVMPSQFINEQ